MPALDQQTIIIIAVVVALVILAVVAAVLLKRHNAQKRRKAMLRERFGPEYDRAVGDSRNEREAVDELAQRDHRHNALPLRDLDDAERDRVRVRMAELQYHFVEDPAETLLEAQRVVTDVLRGMGYPVVTDRAEGLRMLSVDHPVQTQPVRALLQGEYGDDVGDERHLFLDVRTALRDIADVSYDLPDAAGGLRLAAPSAAAADTSEVGAWDGAATQVLPAEEEPWQSPEPADDGREPLPAPGSGRDRTEQLGSGQLGSGQLDSGQTRPQEAAGATRVDDTIEADRGADDDRRWEANPT